MGGRKAAEETHRSFRSFLRAVAAIGLSLNLLQSAGRPPDPLPLRTSILGSLIVLLNYITPSRLCLFILSTHTDYDKWAM